MRPGVATRHPLDSAGLVLPEASWPDEPGSAGMLEPLRRFCNTVNRENGADAWRTPRELAGWLADEGYGEIASIDDTALGRLVALREALWQGVCTNDYAAFAGVSDVLTVRVEPAAIGWRWLRRGQGSTPSSPGWCWPRPVPLLPAYWTA